MIVPGGNVENPVWSYIFGLPKEKHALIELIKSLPVFKGLSMRELVMIERIIHQRKYSDGEIIFGENTPGAGMYIVKEGEVVIKKNTYNDREIELAVIGEQSFFGEMALIDEVPRSASAEARKDTVLLAFCKPDLENLKERNPKIALTVTTNIAQLVCRRLVKANENLEKLEKN